VNRTIKLSLAISLGLLAILFVGGAALAGGDPLVGTWHERDFGTSNIFWFVDDPVGGVYHVLYYDDLTSPTVCGDSGPMLWAGFGEKIGDTLAGTFAPYWCPDNGDGVKTDLLGLGSLPFNLTYDPDTDTVSGANCVGTRQPEINTVEKAIHELAKGKYPPSGIGVDEGCEG
jgi:hypothetical protein